MLNLIVSIGAIATAVLTVILLATIPGQTQSPPETTPSPASSTPSPSGVRTIGAHAIWIYSVAFSPDGQWLVTTSNDTTLRMWNWQTGEQLLNIPSDSPYKWFTAATFTPNQRLIVSTRSDGVIQFWSTQTGEMLGSLPQRAIGYGILSFAADGNTLVEASGQGGDFRIQLWDFARRRVTGTISGSWVSDTMKMTITPDGYTLAAGSEQGTATIWNLRDRQPRSTLPIGATQGALAMALSPDGRLLLISYGDGTVKQWNGETGQLTRTLVAAGPHPVISMAFRPDGKTIAMSLGGYIRLWDLEANRLITTVPCNSAYGQILRFSPDGSALVFTDGSDRSLIRVWRYPVEL